MVRWTVTLFQSNATSQVERRMRVRERGLETERCRIARLSTHEGMSAVCGS